MRHSITHYHLCAVVNTEINKRTAPPLIRILDMGCGNGQLVAFLQQELPRLRRNPEFEVYGFDVIDSGVQPSGYFNDTLENLRQELPDIDWGERLLEITSKEEWPYPEGFFNYVISNQVMEHIFDHDFLFQQIRRILDGDGVSIHLFPLKSYIYEAHLRLPFVHWISNEDLLFAYIKMCSLLGMGKYRKHLSKGYTRDLTEYSQKHTDYMIYETNYLTQAEVYRLAKRNRMRCSFRYTQEFYLSKLRQVLGRRLKYEYSPIRHPLLERLFFVFLVRLSSVTLILEKHNTYA